MLEWILDEWMTAWGLANCTGALDKRVWDGGRKYWDTGMGLGMLAGGPMEGRVPWRSERWPLLLFFFLLHYGDEEGTNWTDAFRGIQNSNKFMLLTKAAWLRLFSALLRGFFICDSALIQGDKIFLLHFQIWFCCVGFSCTLYSLMFKCLHHSHFTEQFCSKLNRERCFNFNV